MPLRSCSSLQGRGTVVTGRVEQGIVKTGDEVEIVGIRPQNTKSTVTGARCCAHPLDLHVLMSRLRLCRCWARPSEQRLHS